jgi:hypothetical protein
MPSFKKNTSLKIWPQIYANFSIFAPDMYNGLVKKIVGKNIQYFLRGTMTAPTDTPLLRVELRVFKSAIFAG